MRLSRRDEKANGSRPTHTPTVYWPTALLGALRIRRLLLSSKQVQCAYNQWKHAVWWSIMTPMVPTDYSVCLFTRFKPKRLKLKSPNLAQGQSIQWILGQRSTIKVRIRIRVRWSSGRRELCTSIECSSRPIVISLFDSVVSRCNCMILVVNWFVMPPTSIVGHYKMNVVSVCLSVHSSVCRWPRLNSRMKQNSMKPKIGMTESSTRVIR